MMQHPHDSNEELIPSAEFTTLDDASDGDSEGGKEELVPIDRPDPNVIVDSPNGDQVYTISDLDTSSPERLATEVIRENPTGVSIQIGHSSPPPSPVVSTPTTRTIRFRSRVRITSGLHKHHRHRQNHPSENQCLLPDQYATSSFQDSLSSSPSSSISVPIRFREDESPSTASSKWGPLGQRVRLFVSRAKQRAREDPEEGGGSFSQSRSLSGRHRRQLDQQRVVLVCDSNVDRGSTSTSPPMTLANENTPLLDGHPHNGSYTHGVRGSGTPYQFSDNCLESESQYQARLNHEIDVVFGKWPRRLLNRHWWWWQLEPILCCRYAEGWDSDY